MVNLSPKGTPVIDLKCPKCGKTQSELKPKDCQDGECPYKRDSE